MILTGLTRKLVEDGLIEEKTAIRYEEQASKSKIPFVTYLIQQNIISPTAIAICASEEFGVPFLDLDAINPEIIPSIYLNEKLMHQHNAVPIYKRGNNLFIALTDPTNLQALDEFKFHSGLKTIPIIVEEPKLRHFIDQILTEQENASVDAALEDASLDDLDITSGEETEDKSESIDTDDAPIVRFVHKILLDAINTGTSDIHFEPYENKYRIRFRQDGILREIANPPVNLSTKLCARIKIMSRLDISERRIPQDGRFKLKLSKNRAIDFRVNTCPTLYGEKVVLRILDSAISKLDVGKLGFSHIQRIRFLKKIHNPQGMILVTGPTGSGKTVTLYTALNILNTSSVNISTAEDPVEINIPGINQVNINPRTNLTFSVALRAFLRQDPDIIMVGEVRDLETAEIAVKAAQTGHLVLSTLHTNSAPETITRLLSMGIPRYNIATSVTLVIAQRLARKLCEHCKKPTEIPKTVLEEQGFDLEQLNKIEHVYRADKCEHCIEGYKGRIGIYEVMPISEEMGNIIMDSGNAMDISKQAAKENIQTIRQNGLEKVITGITTLEEINRITKD